jgi:hypothetical protein
MLLELFLGVFAGIFLFRAGLPAIFPVLLWIPSLENVSFTWILLGLISSGLVWEFILRENCSHLDILVGFIFSVFFLFIHASFFQSISLDFLVFPVLIMAIASWSFFSLRDFPRTLGGGVLLSVAGWWLLHERVISSSLPSFFSGWFGWSSPPLSVYANPSFFRRAADATLGCFLGFLPGLGPGLVHSLWFSGKSSPAMSVSNLIFSIGWWAQTGKVRSAVAAELGSSSSLSWGVILAGLAIAVVLAFFIGQWLCALEFSPPPFAWSFFLLGGIALAGGFSAILVAVGSFSLRMVFERWGIPPSSGSFILLPSILWFYHPF